MDNQKAIEYFYRQMELGYIKNDTQQEIYELAIYALEKQLNDKWIHISEKLPTENEKVLLFLSDNKNKEAMVVGYLYKSERKDFWGDIKFQNKFSSYDGDDIPEFLITDYVKAWRPLPQPYKGGINNATR